MQGKGPPRLLAQPGIWPGLPGGRTVTTGMCPLKGDLPEARPFCNGGHEIVEACTAKLVRFERDVDDPVLDIAKSLQAKDNVTFAVKLKKGYKSQDGTEVKVKKFADAWNFNAYGPNKGDMNHGPGIVEFYPVDARLKDRRIRQASSMAIDREKLQDGTSRFSKTPLRGLASFFHGYKEDACGEYCQFNPTKARALCNEAGQIKDVLKLTTSKDGLWYVGELCKELNANLDVDSSAVEGPDAGGS